MAKGKVTFYEDICKGCGLCVEACPLNIIILDKTRLNSKGYHPAAYSDANKCVGCGSCYLMCPDSALKVEKED